MNYKIISTVQSKNEYKEWLSSIEQVMLHRGFTLENAQHYLKVDESDVLPNELLDNMERGAEILFRHIKANNKIFIQVDSDCDGYTSAAMMINYLRRALNYDNIYYVLHEEKIHGIDNIDRVPEDCKLLIIPDASSNELKIHQDLYKLGKEIIILDHHHAIIDGDPACIINNQTCDYPNKTLSGVGIVYKFCSYIDSLKDQSYADYYLDLVAVGIIADVMKLNEFETRYFIKQGLSNFNNVFLSEFQSKNKFKLSTLNPISVSWFLSPFINAVTRVGEMSEKIILFRAMLDDDANTLVPSTKRGEKGQEEKIVTQAIRMCTNVKKRQAKARDEMVEFIEEKIIADNLNENKALIIAIDDFEINKSLTGLIANQLMSKYLKPVLLMSQHFDEETGESSWSGSGRNLELEELKNWREFIFKSKLANFAEGHNSAFGVSIPEENLEKLIDYCNKNLANIKLEKIYNVDFIYADTKFESSEILGIAENKDIWGQGISEPFVLFKKVPLTSENTMILSPNKSPTLKIILHNGVECIRFRFNQKDYDELFMGSECVFMDIIGTCDVNEWMGKKTPQIKIVNMEVNSRQSYLF